MENSASSSPNKVVASPEPSIEEDSLSEESGWTQYIEDFEAYNNKEDHGGDVHENSSCSSFMSYSMVSDAGSGPEWKNKNTINQGVCPSFGVLPNMPKRLNFKKKIPFDDSLEDTASSPMNNSPKITSFFKRMDINSRKMENDNGSPMGHEISFDEHVEYNNREHEFKDEFGNDVDCIELKQKGLYLVPVSMVVNYLG